MTCASKTADLSQFANICLAMITLSFIHLHVRYSFKQCLTELLKIRIFKTYLFQMGSCYIPIVQRISNVLERKMQTSVLHMDLSHKLVGAKPDTLK